MKWGKIGKKKSQSNEKKLQIIEKEDSAGEYVKCVHDSDVFFFACISVHFIVQYRACNQKRAHAHSPHTQSETQKLNISVFERKYYRKQRQQQIQQPNEKLANDI